MRLRWIILTLLLLACLFAGAYRLSRPASPVPPPLTTAQALAGDTVGYARALVVRPFRFPEDHGPHPDFKTEWWYFTGNVETAEGRHFGYELTLFRIAVAPPGTGDGRASAWATRQVYMGHFALTDVEGRHFYPFERFSRGAVGLAGAQAAPFRVWLEDWTVAEAPGGLPALQLRAATDDVGIDLHLRTLKPVVLQGDRGLDRKGAGAGNASYYYSLTRLETHGTVRLGGEDHAVRGLSWMDREWSTSALDGNQVGWDWFALQLSDGRDLMFYRLRERSGRAAPFSHGVVVDPDGTTRPLGPEAVVLTVGDHWQSPRGAARYPSRWRLRVPSEGLDLDLAPLLADQELPGVVRYWEGAVRVTGQAVDGYGYVEMTGYGDNPALPVPE